jgi:two-component system phosphate regulon sensor histidine kinase PhoR
MPWRNSLATSIVLFPSLAFFALVGVVCFYALPEDSRPVWLWYGSLGLGVYAPIGAFFFSRRLLQRCDDLRAFLQVAPERGLPPSLPVWEADELGVVEAGMQRFIQRQYEYTRSLQGARQDREAVLQSMAEGVIVLDLTSTIVFSNQAASKLFGLSPDINWHGKPLIEFSRQPVLQDIVREVIDNPPGVEAVIREITLEGETSHHLAVSARQMCKDGGAPSGVILALHDLTQVKQLESVRADFVANVSHELRTPLTAIKGYAETLLNGALNDPPIAKRFLSIIDRHSERLSRLIDDLLTLSDLELGKMELHQEELRLAPIVDDVFDLVKDKATHGEVRLKLSLPELLPTLTGDADRFHQVLLNLVDNAVKYTPVGGNVAVSARVLAEFALPSHGHHGHSANGDNGQAQTGLAWVEVAVADTGCGIPQADIPRLTQRFYRVDKARSRELGGTGLGLAIVKHIVQAHRGFLHIESALDQGTTMRVFLPVGQDKRAEQDKQAEQHAVELETGSQL